MSQASAQAAAVQFRPGTIVEFASVEEGRRILGERDLFVAGLSQFDRCVRMKTARPVSEGEFVTYVTNQVRAWSESEKTKAVAALNWIGAQIANLNLNLLERFYLVKTSGNEEGNAAYLRGSSIILPEAFISSSTSQFREVLAHELFHAYMFHNPHLRAAIYGITGFRLCQPIPLPSWLVERRITSPDPDAWNFVIQVQVDGERTPCIPVFYSKSTSYTGGQRFD